MNLNRDREVEARLQPKTAKLSVFISDQILNQNLNSPESKVELYINGSKVNGLSPWWSRDVTGYG
ncbi:MAG TPA: hypothetical protein VJ967_05220 [Clostridia bacterium]|nr:hypothetical protein [Clostridia bacterium]